MEEARHFSYVRHAYFQRVDRGSPDADFRRAEVAYVAWLNASFEALTDSERVHVLEEFAFVDRDESERAFPGFDATVLWGRTLSAWLAAGNPHESKSGDDGARQRVFDMVLGPIGERTDDVVGCSSQTRLAYVTAAKDPKARDRVFAIALSTKDPIAVKTVMANLLGLPSLAPAFAFWHLTERDDTFFRAATRMVGGYAGHCSHPDAIFDALPGIWKANSTPARRGALMYVMRQFTSHREAFGRWFGPLTREEFEAYLDEEPDPLREVHFVWPLLGKGYSHAAPLIARFDRWLTDDFRRNEPGWPETMDTLARDLCDESANGDLARLHAYLDQRANTRPSELERLRAALEHTKVGGCPK